MLTYGLSRGPTNYSPQAKSGPLFVLIKFYWNAATLIHSSISSVACVLLWLSCPHKLEHCPKTLKYLPRGPPQRMCADPLSKPSTRLTFLSSAIYAAVNAHMLRVFGTLPNSPPQPLCPNLSAGFLREDNLQLHQLLPTPYSTLVIIRTPLINSTNYLHKITFFHMASTFKIFQAAGNGRVPHG